MTEKRYFERKWEGEYYIFDSQVISEKEFDEKVEYVDYQAFADSMTSEEVTGRLNKYNKEYLDCHNDVLRLEKENEQLAKEKERYKRLSEIRREEINNRILTIKEFIENCSDNRVKKILKDLFHSEVKEYDLSAQNRKLLHENEQLKQRIEELEFKFLGKKVI